MKITGVIWFTTNSTIGIVTTVNEVGVEKAYINSVSGFDEYEDMRHVAKHGTRFPVKQAKELIQEHGNPHSLDV